jgi:FkbH-like protein
MADSSSQDLKERLELLWDESQHHAGQFLHGAYREALSGPSAIEVSEALAWLNSTNVRSALRPLSVHVLANFVTQGMHDPLELLLQLLGLNPRIEYHPPYHFEANVSEAEAVLLLVDFEKLRATDPVIGSALLRDWLKHLRKGAPRAKILLNEPFFPPPVWPVAPELDIARRSELERELTAAKGESGVTIVRWRDPLYAAGASLVHSASQYAYYDQLLTRGGLGVAANVLARYLAALFTPRKKVICLDADNTLWEGIVGEVGADALLYLPDSPKGLCYHRVLRHLKSLSEAGVLLAIASKNNEKEVLDVLARPDFPLKREDFSAVRINWNSKSRSLREIAEELGLGLDSFVFVDDSAFEIAEVQRALPEVEAVQVPPRPEGYLELISSIPGLDRLGITTEDRERKQEYRAQAERRQMQVEDPHEFTRKLAIAIRVKSVSANEIARVSQLFMKTNQFRFTQSRPGEEEIRVLLKDDQWRVLSVYYRGIFGDSGLVGGALLERAGQGWWLRNMVVSCRVIGRGVEDTLLADWSRRFEPLRIAFEQTGRNQVAELALQRVGWEPGRALVEPGAVNRLELTHDNSLGAGLNSIEAT